MPCRDKSPSYRCQHVDAGLLTNTHLDQDAPGLAANAHQQRPPPAGMQPQTDGEPASKLAREPVAWRDLPRRRQLIIITLARMSEPLVQTSLQSYMYYQLKWFSPESPDALISRQAGILHASFMAAQFLTAMAWGRVADSPRAGRKTVLLIGLLGTSLSCLGFGFSTSFRQALVFRTLGGSTNGNIGVMRTMISEIIREKRFQARAFLLLPMTFNIGVIVGPMLGGILSDPAGTYPRLFGHVRFFVDFPYAAPNIVSCVFLLLAAAAVWLGLEETLDSLRDAPPDLGTRAGSRLAGLLRSVFRRGHAEAGYVPIPSDALELATDGGGGDGSAQGKLPARRYTRRLPFRRIFTRNVALTLFAQFFLTFHIGTFNSLWFVFLSTPVFDPSASDHGVRLPFRFTGGIGMHPQAVGVAMAILGVIGIALQLFFYPRMSERLGTLMSWRVFLLLFPMAYFLVPYLSVVPSTSGPPHSKTGAAIWLSICGVLFIQVMGRTFALPSQAILINNCSPHPSVLGTVHGLGQSVSSFARTVGPIIGGVVYGFGLSRGYVGLVFWLLSCVAICACLASLLVKEGDGHEIWLEGDEEEPNNETGRY
ncbi:MFS transporter [Metarhizium robertsii]|uniref:Major facilitator superfamily transporter n=2 Tax=Metarhizium robertsii TaxID=568076 RepID=E9ESB7_METRA|nr:Major facilitator superfamily transporter [Metarhizium robertsii ARSEF 23]EFZ01634.2 Major facilitator superfamily transporter [Metarhizium robertsii ARSEF 23]EXV01477.1 MFS transporter [Metarhizium robertsii]